MNLIDIGERNGRRLYTGLRLDYRLRLWAPTSASRAISAVAELLVECLDFILCTYGTSSECLGHWEFQGHGVNVKVIRT